MRIPRLFRRRAARQGQRGLTLLEIMIVIAILGLLVVVVVPRVMDAFGKSHTDIAKLQVDEWKGYYNRWLTSGPEKSCTEVNLYDDVGKYVDKNMNAEELKDTWGHPIALLCDDSGFKGIYSFGENGTDEKGAGDDVNSWEKPKKK